MTQSLAVQQFLRTTENPLKALEEQLAIKVKEYPEEGLVILSYDQINSPKAHPIVVECRGLILELGTWNVVSRCFDRFFDLGEMAHTQKDIDPKTAILKPKHDGSLIQIYKWRSKWHVGARGTAFAEGRHQLKYSTNRHVVMQALGLHEGLRDGQLTPIEEQLFQEMCEANLEPTCTTICEIVAPETRVVTHYHRPVLHYLACRSNIDGSYVDATVQASGLGLMHSGQHSMHSVEEATARAASLTDLREGFVIYQNGVPRAKLKSPVYEAAHLIREKGLTPKLIARLVIWNGIQTYANYYPTDPTLYEGYVRAHKQMFVEAIELWTATKQIQDQKQFALLVKDKAYQGILFAARKLGAQPPTWTDAMLITRLYDQMSEGWKVNCLMALVSVEDKTGSNFSALHNKWPDDKWPRDPRGEVAQ